MDDFHNRRPRRFPGLRSGCARAPAPVRPACGTASGEGSQTRQQPVRASSNLNRYLVAALASCGALLFVGDFLRIHLGASPARTPPSEPQWLIKVSPVDAEPHGEAPSGTDWRRQYPVERGVRKTPREAGPSARWLTGDGREQHLR